MTKSFSADILILHREKALCDLLSAEAEFCGYKTIVFSPEAYENIWVPPVRLIICDADAVSFLTSANDIPQLLIYNREPDKNPATPYLKRPFLLSDYRETLKNLIKVPSSKALLFSALPYMAPDRKKVVYCGQSIDITPSEAKILEALLEMDGEPVARSELARRLGETNSNTVDVYICFLRRKFSAISPTNIIHAVRGFGYKIGLK